jgi:hypothetical protein
MGTTMNEMNNIIKPLLRLGILHELKREKENQLNGLSPKGDSNGSSEPLLPPPRGPGGLTGGVVIITRDIELSSNTLVITGFWYARFGNIS